MVEQLHWLHLSACIQFKMLILVLSQLCLAPQYLLILRHNFAALLCPLRLSDCLDLLVTHVRIAMAPFGLPESSILGPLLT